LLNQFIWKIIDAQWFIDATISIRIKFFELYGEQDGYTQFRTWFSGMLKCILIICLFFGCISILARNFEFALVGFFVGFIVPLIMIKRIGERCKARSNQILFELPDFLNRLLIRLCSGDPLRQAIINSVLPLKDAALYPLNSHFHEVITRLRNNHSLQNTLEQLNKRIKILEVSKIIAILLLYQQRGGPDFIITLREANQSLWLLRKSIARKKGEEASTKALLPMLLIFSVMLMIIGSPAFLMMQK